MQTEFVQWLTRKLSVQLDDGESEIKIPKLLSELKVPMIQWLMSSWLSLKEREDVIASGWSKPGLDRITDIGFQMEAFRELQGAPVCEPRAADAEPQISSSDLIAER